LQLHAILKRIIEYRAQGEELFSNGVDSRDVVGLNVYVVDGFRSRVSDFHIGALAPNLLQQTQFQRRDSKSPRMNGLSALPIIKTETKRKQ